MAVIYAPLTKIPEISVIIPAFNVAATIDRALNSVVRQQLDSEIIIVDDLSTDNLKTVLQDWSEKHPDQPLKLIELPRHSYALKARLAGLEEAAADNVIFLDGDDEWYGDQNLMKALAKKKNANVEMVHFRTFGMSPPPDSAIIGELLWTAPPDHEYLYGSEIFAAYAEKEYPPLQVWNKIYSRQLLMRAALYVKNCDVFYFDDKLFVSVILLCAESWASSNEYIYQYNPKLFRPLELYAKWVHDIYIIIKKLAEIMPLFNVAPEAAEAILGFYDRRMKLHCGNLCIRIEEELFQGNSVDTVLAKMTEWLPLSVAIQCVTKGAYTNIQRLLAIMDRVYGQY